MAGAILDAVAAVLLVVGLLLATIGLYGMLRRPEVLDQLHAAGMVTGPALVLILLASIATREAEIITSAALVLIIVLVTSPLSGHAIAQAIWRRDRHTAELRERRAGGRAEPDATRERA
jgi:multicomponent Na+:H+ antiporter subunit G